MGPTAEINTLSLLSSVVLDEYFSSVEFPARLQKGTKEDCDAIARYGAIVGSVIRVYPSLGRTMDRARSYITDREQKGMSVASGSLILASTLNQSKGRFQRPWHAPLGGIWGCLILADTFLPLFRNILPLIPGVACCEAVRQEGVSGATIRWVNDVLIQEKKQAGFLIEGFSSPMHHEQYHLIGFGLNVNNGVFPEELRGSATSLSLACGHSLDIYSFALSFFAKMRWYTGLLFHEEIEWLARGGGEEYLDEHPILKRWKELSDSSGRRVRFGYDVMENPQYEAVVMGVSHNGGLILLHDDGNVSVENSGEIRYC